MVFGHPKKFDGKFRGEIWQISPFKLANFSPRFAVKLQAIFKMLIFKHLQSQPKNSPFCKIFLPNSTHVAIHLKIKKQNYFKKELVVICSN